MLEKLRDARVLVALAGLITALVVVYVPEFEEQQTWIQENFEYALLFFAAGSVSVWAYFQQWLVRDEDNIDLVVTAFRLGLQRVDKKLVGDAIPDSAIETFAMLFQKWIEDVAMKAKAREGVTIVTETVVHPMEQTQAIKVGEAVLNDLEKEVIKSMNVKP